MKEGEQEKEKRKEKEEKEDKKKVEEEEVNIDFDDDVQDLAFVQTFLSTYRDNRTIASKHSDVCTALSSLPPSHISPGQTDAAITGTGTGKGAGIPLNGAGVPLKDTIYNSTEMKNSTFGFGFDFTE